MQPHYRQSYDIISARPISQGEEYFKRLLILCGVFSSVYFLIWLTDTEHISFLPLYSLLVASAFYAMSKVYLEWYAVWKFRMEGGQASAKTWTVDVLTTYCKGEPKEMIINTLKAIQSMKYPHTAYLCDEDNDQELKGWCERLGVIHVTRTDKSHAKAGNINNALRTLATGELCLILDPDHIPNEDFLDNVVAHFEDEKIGYVQAVQGYYNQDSTVIARAAAEQTYLFYGPIMIGLNALGTVPAIGANCIFRRSALDSIGGHAPGLTEDMHTAMLLHAKGWKSVYIPKVLNRGLVPWNFSGYCKQQLKWARGTFDLMFNKLPGIFKNLTFNQRVYYISCGFFYTYGFKVLIDILLPIIALFMVKVPLRVDIIDFYKHFIPFWVMIQFIRLYCQRWLMGERERGLYLLGSILLKSSWWVAIAGFIYTLIGKNVPYIPTPKHNSPETPWLILMPNFVVITISAVAIVYGLRADFNPYSILMAFIALFNIATLGLGTLMAMQTWIPKIHGMFKRRLITKNSWLRIKFYNLRMMIYRRAENGMAVLFMISVIIFIVAQFYFPKSKKDPNALREVKDFGGMNIHGAVAVESHANVKGGLQRFDLAMGETEFLRVSESIDRCIADGHIPFIYLQHTDSLADAAYVRKELRLLIEYVRNSPNMIFISLQRGEVSEMSYYQNMLDLASVFAANGAGSVAWTWEFLPAQDSLYLNRSINFVSWILDESKDPNTPNKKVHTIPGEAAKLPVTFFTNRQNTFLQSGMMLANHVDTSASTSNNPDAQPKRVSENDTQNAIGPNDGINAVAKRWEIRDRKLHVGTKQIFIKGIAYNPGHDWQDDRFNIALTRDKLREDFKAIREMGANTIRRYSPGISDYNIFNAATEADLNVIYGFWFDPKIDYATDEGAKQKYRKDVLSKVQSYETRPCILGWAVGNETWGLLKHNYGEPYLTEVRKKYVEFIESLAKEIHKMDPGRPVFTMGEHTPMLVTELNMYQRLAPSIDVYGINSYYEQDLIQVDSLMQQFFPEQNYFLSEFGPSGYWKNEYNLRDSEGKLSEVSSYDKANLYRSNWSRFVVSASERNLGGVAFCWQDRFEGTSTWFGLTDIHGYKKPSYYALAEAWTGKKHKFSLPNITILQESAKTNSGLGRYYAVTPSGHRIGGYKFKWIVYDNITFEKKFEQPFSDAGVVDIPEELRTDANRLYLYMADVAGNVVTASLNFSSK
jgi:cellulose synthase (UDP-forming)